MTVIACKQVLQSSFMAWNVTVECSKEFTDYHEDGCSVCISNCGSQSVDCGFTSIEACQFVQDKAN